MGHLVANFSNVWIKDVEPLFQDNAFEFFSFKMVAISFTSQRANNLITTHYIYNLFCLHVHFAVWPLSNFSTELIYYIHVSSDHD